MLSWRLNKRNILPDKEIIKRYILHGLREKQVRAYLLTTMDRTAKGNMEQQSNKTTIKGFRASSTLIRIKLDDFQTSTKIEALVCTLKYLYLQIMSLYPVTFLLHFEPLSLSTIS